MHLSSETLQRYRDGEVATPDEIREIDAHLVGCDPCRQELRAQVSAATPRLVRDILPDDREPSCLSEEQIAAYAQGTADEVERELVESHIAHCARCREDVDSLRAFHEQMQTYDWERAERHANRTGPRERAHQTADHAGRWVGRGVAAWGRISLSLRILIALALGGLTGSVLGDRARALAPISEGIQKLLTAVAVPLIFIGVMHALMRAEIVGRPARRLLVLMVTNTFVAIGFGLLVGNLLQPGRRAQGVQPPIGLKLPPVPDSLLQPVVQSNVLFVLLFALGLGSALRLVRQEQMKEGRTAYRAMEDLLETAFRCLLLLLQWVIATIPAAVFVIGAMEVARSGLEAFRPLAALVGATLLALSLQVGYYLLRLRLGSRIPLSRLLLASRSALLTAFSTASSAATLPVTYANIKDRLEVSEEAVSLGVLVGGNFNRDGTALFEALGVLFIAQAHGLPFGAGHQAILALMAAVASVCAPGIPEAGLVTMALIFQALGMPEGIKYIILLIPLDPLLDRCRTVVNVMGHITVACLLNE
jgi:DAACS family dicarboxylate/amino acid:cation (Na+ or H+) symporter